MAFRWKPFASVLHNRPNIRRGQWFWNVISQTEFIFRHNFIYRQLLYRSWALPSGWSGAERIVSDWANCIAPKTPRETILPVPLWLSKHLVSVVVLPTSGKVVSNSRRLPKVIRGAFTICPNNAPFHFSIVEQHSTSDRMHGMIRRSNAV